MGSGMWAEREVHVALGIVEVSGLYQCGADMALERQEEAATVTTDGSHVRSTEGSQAEGWVLEGPQGPRRAFSKWTFPRHVCVLTGWRDKPVASEQHSWAVGRVTPVGMRLRRGGNGEEPIKAPVFLVECGLLGERLRRAGHVGRNAYTGGLTELSEGSSPAGGRVFLADSLRCFPCSPDLVRARPQGVSGTALCCLGRGDVLPREVLADTASGRLSSGFMFRSPSTDRGGPLLRPWSTV